MSRSRRPPPVQRRLQALGSAVLVGALYAGFLALPSAAAAFTGRTSTGSNSLASGTVVISDDDSGTHLFSNDVLGTTATVSCIAVSYTGTATSAVKLYAALGGDSSVYPYTTLKVEEGTGGSSSTCTGFSATSTLVNTTLNSWTATSYAAGLSSWAPSSSATRTYRFSLSVSGSTPIAQQGLQLTLNATWEARAGT